MKRASQGWRALVGVGVAAAALAALAPGRAGAQFVPGVGVVGTPFRPATPINGTAYTGVFNYTPTFGSYGGYGIGVPGFGYGYGWGAPGFGYGIGGFGYGWGGAYGGLGYTIGMTAADQAMVKYQTYALNAAQYNLTNAQTALSYQAALLYRQEALNSLLRNRLALAAATRPPVAPQESSASLGEVPAEEGNRLLPLNQLVATDGKVLWPLGAPDKGELGARRQAADQAIQGVIRRFAGGDRVPVRDIVAARKALSDYSVPAADQLRAKSDKDYDGFARFVQSLDAGLRNIDRVSAVAEGGAKPARGESPAQPIDLTPENAPKTGGDAVKGAIVDQDTDTQPRPAAERNPARPEPEGARSAVPDRGTPSGVRGTGTQGPRSPTGPR